MALSCATAPAGPCSLLTPADLGQTPVEVKANGNDCFYRLEPFASSVSLSAVPHGRELWSRMHSGEKGDEKTLTITESVKVNKGKYNTDTKKLEAGDPIDDGLKNAMFSSIGEKGIRATVVTDDDNKKIIEIRVAPEKKKQ